MSQQPPQSPSPDDLPPSDLPASSAPGETLAIPTTAELEAELAGIASAHSDQPPVISTPKRRKKHRQDPTPRVLVIIFCLWMLGSWIISLSASSLVQPSQWMVICSVIAIMVFWPVLRLSQWRDDPTVPDNGSADILRTPWRVWVDWLCLNLLFQTVLWPLHMNAHWRLDQSLWISATIASWSLITGALVAMGCQTDRSSRRMLAAALCILLLVGEPLLVAFTGRLTTGDIIFLTSPLALIWQLTSSASHWLNRPWELQVPIIAAAGVMSWIVLTISTKWWDRSSEHQMS